MLKVFRIPEQNPISWQQSLIDSEISQILSGRAQILAGASSASSAYKQASSFNSNPTVARRSCDDVW